MEDLVGRGGSVAITRGEGTFKYKTGHDQLDPVSTPKLLRPNSKSHPLSHALAAEQFRRQRTMSTGAYGSFIRGKQPSMVHAEPQKKTRVGSVISFHHINYEIKVKKERKQILRDVSGIFGPGMNAIMGQAGGGKSSCLDVLAGRKDPSGLTGDVLIDGHRQPENFKCMCGYVVADDVVMGTLTVKENLMFSANLRLPHTMSKEDKEARVMDVIGELGLRNCADTKVGTELIRGISGGERKRTNIGMELIIQPPVLFMDEPTNGLDSNTANSVCALLSKMARKGRTIIFSINQPRFSIFRLFDRLLLLVQGGVIYHGLATEAIDYFDSIGFSIDEMNNPPDFFLDVINGDTDLDRKQLEPPTSNGVVEDDDDNEQDDVNAMQNSTAPDVAATADHRFDRMNERCAFLTKAYKNSEWKQLVSKEIEPIMQDYNKRVAENTEVPLKAVEHVNGWGHQMKAVSGRAVLNILRNPMTSVVQLVIVIIQAFIFGVIYWQIGENPENAIQDRVGIFFLAMMSMVFGSLSSVELFIKERPIFIHENISGFYRVSVYFTAKALSDLLPRRTLPVLTFSLIVYWMVGLRIEVDSFFYFVLGMLFTTISSAGIAFFVSASVAVFSVANTLTTLLYLFMMVFAGLLVNLDTMPGWLSWLRFFSIQYYGFNTLCIAEFKNNEFCDYDALTNTTTCVNGNDYLEVQGIDSESEWDIWKNILALGVIAIGYLFLAYVQLLRMKKLN